MCSGNFSYQSALVRAAVTSFFTIGLRSVS